MACLSGVCAISETELSALPGSVLLPVSRSDCKPVVPRRPRTSARNLCGARAEPWMPGSCAQTFSCGGPPRWGWASAFLTSSQAVLLLPAGTPHVPNQCRAQFETSPERWALGSAQSVHSINTCWFAASNDTEMKYKGKIKYIKALIKCTAWFSLRLSWFLLCPGHVGSVLIFMASVSLLCRHFPLLQGSPPLPFLFLAHFRENTNNSQQNPQD